MKEETRFAFVELKFTTLLKEINLFPCSWLQEQWRFSFCSTAAVVG